MRLTRLCVLGLAAAFSFSFPAHPWAQTHTQVRAQGNLSPAALAKLATLESLNTLPAADWHFHVGDLAHGESPTLDDSSWTTVHPGTNGPNEAVWYRRLVEVPKTLNGYDISGSRVLFQFRADANGPVPEIIYFNGRRVALGDDLEPIILFDAARPGDKVLIAVKLLQTVDAKRFRAATLRIEPNPESAAHRPSPDEIRTQAIAAANILPALTPARRDLLPKVEEAVAAIDMNALTSANQAAFDASLGRAQAILATLHGALSAATIDLTGNAHIDAAWLWPRTETVDVVKRTFTTALQLMNEYPDYTFSQSAAQYTEWMADKYPALNAQIKQRVKEGRWEIVGGMWVEPDLNLPDGETTVRQLLLGTRYFHQQYGVTTRIGWNPDSFGYNWQLPQIYKRSGLDYFVTQKMHWNDTNQLPFRLFWWESPDGSKVLTYFPTDYVHDNVNPARISADFAQSAERNPGTAEMMDLYGIGDHGGGPTRAMLDQGDHWIAAGKGSEAVPTMRYHTAQGYFSSVETHLNPDSPMWNYDRIATGYKLAAPPAGEMSLPTWKDELYFEYHRGIFTTQAGHKRSMRQSEVATLDAEKLASLAWLAGTPYPNAELTDAWKKITFNGFHDLAAGSGIGIIYKDAQADFTEVFHADREISAASLHTLAARVDTRVQAGVPVLLFNSLAWPRSETVRLTVQLPEQGEAVAVLDGHMTPVLSQVVGSDPATNTYTLLVHAGTPALGYSLLHVTHVAKNADPGPKTPLRATETASAMTLENGSLRVSLDRKTGCITSLFDLKTRTESLAANACGNQLQTFRDLPKEYDAWNVDPGTLDHNTPIDEVDSVSLVDRGPLRATVRVARTWQSSKFVQDISLDADADTVDILNNIDWHETHVLLKAAFPLAATGPRATFEIPYGSIERPTTRNNSWEQAKFEVPALRWADLGDGQHGMSLLNDSKYGYDALGNTLRLTLLRSPTWPDPDADRSHQTFRYALYPHPGTWKSAMTMHRGYELNYPTTAQQVGAHTGSLPAEHSFASVENPNVLLTAMKKAEDSDALIVRMVEWAGQESQVKLHVPSGATAAKETNLMEKPVSAGSGVSLAGETVTATIHPFEILTLEVSYPGHATAAAGVSVAGSE